MNSSISGSKKESSSQAKLIDIPSAPARPVRPIRCNNQDLLERVVDHVADTVDMDTSSRDIGRHQDSGPTSETP